MNKTVYKQSGPLKRVLLVEDDRDVNDAFATVLKAGGYEVLQVYNGREALEKIADYKPEIILLDLLMPVMGGNDFLKAYENKQKIPIIVFSSLDSRSEVQEALEHGATRYMLKAWATPEELFQVINNTI